MDQRPREYWVTLYSPDDPDDTGEASWWATGGMAWHDGTEYVIDSSGTDFDACDSLAEMFDQVRDEVEHARRTNRVTVIRWFVSEGGGDEWERGELVRLAGVEPPE